MKSRKPMQFVVGDLVYYTKKTENSPTVTVNDTVDNHPVGIVARVGRFNGFSGTSAVYAVYWLKDGIVSAHLANNLELVYNV